MTNNKENASRHNVLPTLSTQTSRVSDSIGLHETPAVQAPYFYPARDGGNQKCSYLYPAQDGGRTQDQDGNTTGEAKRRSTCKVTQRNAQQPPHSRASSTKDHAAPNPRSRDRAAGQKDQPEPPCEKRKMRKTGGSPMPPAVKNSRTVTPFMPVPPTEKQVNTLASTPRATHIRTVPKRPSTNRTVLPCSMMSQPVTPRGNAGRKRQTSAIRGASGRRLPLPCKPTNESPLF